MLWKHNKEKVNEALNLNALPVSQSKEHWHWTNTATTPRELSQDILAVKDQFLTIIQDTCEKTGVHYYAGKDNQFLIKSEKSIDQKIQRLTAGGANPTEALRRINDGIRASLLGNSVDEIKKAIVHFNEEAEKVGVKALFSNKWDESYENGYVGIHCNLLLSYTAPDGSEKHVRGELQFHFKQIVNGTPQSPNAVAHHLYEQGRINETNEVEHFVKMEWLQFLRPE